MFDGFDLDSDFIRNLDMVNLEGSYTCSFFGDHGAIVSPKTYFSMYFSPIGAYSGKAGSDFVPLSYHSHQLFNSMVSSPVISISATSSTSSNKPAMYSSWPVLPSSPFPPHPSSSSSCAPNKITAITDRSSSSSSSFMSPPTPSSFGRRDGEFSGGYPFSSYSSLAPAQLNSSSDHANRGMINVQMPKPKTCFNNSDCSSSNSGNSNSNSNSNSKSDSDRNSSCSNSSNSSNRSSSSSSSSSDCSGCSNRNNRNKSKKNVRSRKILEKLPSSVSVFGEIYTEIYSRNRSDMDDNDDGGDYGDIHTGRIQDEKEEEEEEEEGKKLEEQEEQELELSINFTRPVAATESGNAFIDRVLSAEGNKRGRKSLSNFSTNVLRSWIVNHHENPYPNQKEKEELARDAKLTVKQVVDWMTNVRKRKLTPYLPKSAEGVVASLPTLSL